MKRYPKKRKENEARKVFQELTSRRDLPDLLTLLHEVTKEKESEDWQKENGRYIPTLANWLRRRTKT